jgi:hypothetical protein
MEAKILRILAKEYMAKEECGRLHAALERRLNSPKKGP